MTDFFVLQWVLATPKVEPIGLSQAKVGQQLLCERDHFKFWQSGGGCKINLFSQMTIALLMGESNNWSVPLPFLWVCH